jgi:hypothetical protein
VVGDSNPRKYQSNHGAEKEPSEEHGNQDENGNKNEIENGTAGAGGVENEKETEKTPDGGMAYWYDFNNPPKEKKGPPATEEAVGTQKTWVPNLNAEEFIPENQPEMIPNDKEELDEDEISINMDVHCRTKIMTMNVRSAVSDEKKAQIRLGVDRIDPDIIILTETWFCCNDGEFTIQGYSPITRCDRPHGIGKEPKSNGGGVQH